MIKVDRPIHHSPLKFQVAVIRFAQMLHDLCKSNNIGNDWETRLHFNEDATRFWFELIEHAESPHSINMESKPLDDFDPGKELDLLVDQWRSY
jgi:hypothetical protein